ncbi:MAG: putative signal transduction histidine kinase [Verrucomicrobiales bacterium]|nr:putative signal transduction histidine kinase [Verrucomicrobiales bacterium]
MSHDHDREIRFSHSVLPARPPQHEPLSAGPVTRKIMRAENALQQRVEFEALVSRISSLFVRLKSEEIDRGIHEALREMGEFLRVDHCHLCRVHHGGELVDHTHEWAAGGSPHPWAGTRGLRLDEHLPWSAVRLRRLDGIAIYSVDTLSAEAALDRETFHAQGIKSVIFVPMAVGGQLVGFIGLDSTQHEMHWTEDAISLLKIVGGILADALDRRRAEDALRKENDFTQALLNATGAIFIVLDAVGKIVRFNHAAETASGYMVDDVKGRAPWDLFIPRDERAAARRNFKLLTTEATASAFEGSVVSRFGKRRVISWSNTALPSEDGRTVEYVIMSGIDVTDTKRLEAEVLNVAEREQSRFGHDLHDGLGQHLTGIEFMSQVLSQRLAAQGRATEASDLDQITGLIREAISQTRDLARGLSPVVLQSKGLAVALQDLAASATKHLRLSCQCHLLYEGAEPEEDPEMAIHLYRIAQEAVANAAKHGRASRIMISLGRIEGRTELVVEDNGTGLPKGGGQGLSGMGLRVMQYRAGLIGGTLHIGDSTSGGVAITCSIEPVRAARPDGRPAPLPQPPSTRK